MKINKEGNPESEFNNSVPVEEGSVIQRVLKSDERIKPVCLSVLVFSILAHLYRYTNTAFNSDSLGIYRGGINFYRLISRGRWAQPLYLYIRGMISAPFLIGLLATVYLALSIILIVKILDIKDRGRIIILCGLLSVAPAITITNAAFVPFTDVFMLSLLFSVIGAWCLTSAKTKGRYLIAALFLVLSLALYQAYICACLLLCLFWLIRGSLTGENIRNVVRSAVMMAVTFAAALLLYYGTYKICGLFYIEDSQSYNSVGNATILRGDFHILSLIKGVYSSVFQFVLKPETFYSKAAGGINIIMISISAVLLFLMILKKDAWRGIIALSLALLSPIAAYFIYILYGKRDSVMNFPLVMLYAGVFMLLEAASPDIERSLMTWLSKAVIFLSGFLIFLGVVYSNQLYLKKSVEELETLSLMTRVLYYMEQTEGYVPGETKIAMIGSLNNSDAVAVKPGYDSLTGRSVDKEVSIMYYNNYRMYLTNIMGYPITLADQEEAEELGRQQTVIDMPAFPYPGCTKMLGDVMVVKLSETDR